MDETLQNTSTESMPKNCSCITGCSGSSNKKLSKDMKAAAVNSSKNNKTTSLTFLSRFCTNKSTVEIKHAEAAVSEKPCRSTKEFTDQKNYKQAAGINKTYIPAAAGDTNNKVHNHKKKNSDIEKHSEFHQSILLVKDSNLKKEKKRSRSSSFGALQVENIGVPTKTTRLLLPHSISLPPKIPAVRGENDIDHNGRETQGKLDPIVGMTIMMGTLVIMLLWGKVCAILCTCAWLYMLPRLRTIVDSKETNSGALDFESVEYKKRVVLEGLLKRDRRRVVGNL